MTRDSQRRQLDPIWWHQVRARLARIKIAIAVKQVNEVLSIEQMRRPTGNMAEGMVFPDRRKERSE